MKLLVLTIALAIGVPVFAASPEGFDDRVETLRNQDRAARLRRGNLPREDDVFFCPGVDLLTMRASQLVILERRVRVEIFVDR
jgi:hypothetical protein